MTVKHAKNDQQPLCTDSLTDDEEEAAGKEDTASCGEDDPTEALTATSPARFWILTIFSLLSIMHGVVWNTFGPISESMNAAFPGWGASTVAMINNWGSVMFVVFVLPMSWATQKWGLRAGVVTSTALFFLGTGVRCLSPTPPLFTVLCHLGAALAGVGSSFVLSAPPLLAASWFPPEERSTAVAVIMAAGQMSQMCSYLEPLLVRLPSSTVSVSEIQQDVMDLLYITAGISGCLLVAVLVYFPSKPRLPPSTTSVTTRLDIRPALAALVRNKRWMALLVAYGVSVGPMLAWTSLLDVSLLPLGFHQDQAMWVAQGAILWSTMFTVVVGRFNDLVRGHTRLMLICLMLATTFSLYWFLLITYGVIQPVKCLLVHYQRRRLQLRQHHALLRRRGGPGVPGSRDPGGGCHHRRRQHHDQHLLPGLPHPQHRLPLGDVLPGAVYVRARRAAAVHQVQLHPRRHRRLPLRLPLYSIPSVIWSHIFLAVSVFT